MAAQHKKQEKYDILVWAHSDQQGGTEIPCVLAASLLRAASSVNRPLSVAIVTPFPNYVEEFCRFDSFCRPGRQPAYIKSPSLLRLEKTDGAVDSDKTAGLVDDSFINDNYPTFLDGVVGRCLGCIQENVHKGRTLIVSCGEPVAIRVAEILKLKSIIVTDHMLTYTIRWVLENGGWLRDERARLMTRFEEYDRLACEAFLSPVEFASPEYVNYLAMGGLPCTPLYGLFYDPISRDDLPEAYTSLKQTVNTLAPDPRNVPSIVCVFGGGGSVWDGIYLTLHEQARSSVFRDMNFALLLKDADLNARQMLNRKWRLYVPGANSDGVDINDPGKMMYWYAACRLVVARGGLAAQQVLATMLGDCEEVPQMLFIEEPGHPQIESERLSLFRLGLVHTRTLEAFRQAPLEIIAGTLSNDINARSRARVRYGRNAVESLSKSILGKYLGFSW